MRVPSFEITRIVTCVALLGLTAFLIASCWMDYSGHQARMQEMAQLQESNVSSDVTPIAGDGSQGTAGAAYAAYDARHVLSLQVSVRGSDGKQRERILEEIGATGLSCVWEDVCPNMSWELLSDHLVEGASMDVVWVATDANDIVRAIAYAQWSSSENMFSDDGVYVFSNEVGGA